MSFPNQIIFRRGAATVVRLNEDNEPSDTGNFWEVESVSVVGLGAPLPLGMFAGYTVRRRMEDGHEAIDGRLQARATGGRRYFHALTENAAQARLLKWATRILRERDREQAARRPRTISELRSAS